MFRILHRYLLRIVSILLAGTYITVNATTLTHDVISAGGDTVPIVSNIFLGYTIGQSFIPAQTSQFIAGFWHGQEISSPLLPVALIVDGNPIASTCGNFDVTIQVQAPNESPVVGAELYLEYDENILQVVSIKPGSKFDTPFKPVYDNKHIEFAAYDLSGASFSGKFELLTIKFKVKINWSGTSPTILKFDKSKTEVYSADNPPQPLLQSVENIELPIVNGATSVPGQVKIAQLGTGRANMPLRVRVDPTAPAVQHIKTTAPDNFTLNGLTSGQIVYVSQTNTLQQKQTAKITNCKAKTLNYKLVRGDVSGENGPDNLIDMKDALALRQIIVSNTPEPNKDYNLDGQVTEADRDPSFIQVHFDLNDDNKLDRSDPLLLNRHFKQHGDETNESSPFHLKKGIKELLDVQAALFPDNLSSSLSSGESFDVIIDVQAGSHGVIAAEAYLDFDPRLLRVNHITTGGQLDTEIHNFFDNSVGRAEFAAIHLKENGISGTFKLMVINVTVLGEGGEQTLTLNQTQTKIWGEDNQVLPDVPVEATPYQKIPKGYYSDPDPQIDISDSQVSMKKELSGYPNYGVIDGKADVLYSEEENNWWFKLPPDLNYTNGQVTLSLVLDDHYDINESEYCARILVNGNELFSGSLASLGIKHGEPYGQPFTNWQSVSFPLQINSGEMEVRVINCSNLAMEEWIAIDNIILEANYQPRLAVELLSFNAQAIQQGTLVEWQSAHEEDLLAYDLWRGTLKVDQECTTHQEDYEAITHLTAEQFIYPFGGTDSEHLYQFVDNFTAINNTSYCYGLLGIEDNELRWLGVTPRQ